MKLILLALLLLAQQAAYATGWPTNTHSRRYYARQQRKAIARRQVKPHKVHPAYNRNKGLRSLITF